MKVKFKGRPFEIIESFWGIPFKVTTVYSLRVYPDYYDEYIQSSVYSEIRKTRPAMSPGRYIGNKNTNDVCIATFLKIKRRYSSVEANIGRLYFITPEGGHHYVEFHCRDDHFDIFSLGVTL